MRLLRLSATSGMCLAKVAGTVMRRMLTCRLTGVSACYNLQWPGQFRAPSMSHGALTCIHASCVCPRAACTPQGNANKVMAKLKQDWWEMCQANWVLWIPAQFVNFRFVPPNLQARLCYGGQTFVHLSGATWGNRAHCSLLYGAYTAVNACAAAVPTPGKHIYIGVQHANTPHGYRRATRM